MRIRYIVNDVDAAKGNVPPGKYRRAYRIPGTNVTMYCRFPLNYPARWLERAGSFCIGVLMRPIWHLFAWIFYPRSYNKLWFKQEEDNGKSDSQGQPEED